MSNKTIGQKFEGNSAQESKFAVRELHHVDSNMRETLITIKGSTV
jgi:hypothetical protein